MISAEAPIVEILSKGKNTHFIGQVQLSRPIEIEDGVEGSGVSVEEELVLNDGIIAAERDDLPMGSSSGEKAQSGEGNKREKPPQNLRNVIWNLKFEM